MSERNSEFQIVIEADTIQKEYLKDLYRYRELFYFFSWRDIIVRYKQTLLGVAWAVLRPLLNMAVFALVFGKIANLDSDGINYPLFVLAGMVPWQFFANSLLDSSSSLIAHAPMVSKIYFPRMILPSYYIIVSFIDFLISLATLIAFFLVTQTPYQWNMVMLPLFVLLTVLLCLGASLWLSALTVRFRDFRFLVPFIVQFGMFISPVGYGSFLVSDTWRWLYFLNPMAGIIEGFRWSCFGVYHSYLPLALGLSISITAALLVTGFRFFRKMERIFADII